MEILGIGTDIEQSARFSDVDDTFLSSIFSPEELSYATSKSQPEQHLAGMFCAKEAVIKATSQDFSVLPAEVLIQHDRSGKPQAAIPSKNISVGTIMLSIAHTKKYATATAIYTK